MLFDSKLNQIYNPATMQQRVKICASCNQEIHGYIARSRRDNKTLICGLCSILEAKRELEMWLAAARSRSVN